MDKTLALEYLQHGRTLLGISNYDNAIDYFKKAEREDPFNIDIYIDMGVTYTNFGQFDNAEKCFIKALKVNKEAGIVYYHLGNIRFLQDDRTKGIQYYNQAISNGYETAQMYFSLGLMYEEDGNFIPALHNYSKAIMLEPFREDAYIRKARIFIGNRRYPEALQTLDELIMACPDRYEGYHLKYEVSVSNGRLDEARNILDKAKRLFEFNQSFLFDQADLYVNLNQFDDALLLMDEAVKKDQGGLDKHGIAMERARIAALTGNMNNTISYLKEAIRIAGEGDKPDFVSEATFFLMNCYINIESYSEALDCSRKLKESEDVENYYLSAYYYEPYCLQKLHHTEEALDLYQKGAEALRNYSLMNPENTDCYVFRILCLKELKQYDKALELSDYLLRIKRDAVELHAIRAIILSELGRDEEANSEKAKARELGGIPSSLSVI